MRPQSCTVCVKNFSRYLRQDTTYPSAGLVRRNTGSLFKPWKILTTGEFTEIFQRQFEVMR